MDFEIERKNLVESLKKQGYIKTKHVEEAFLKTPRELFVPENQKRNSQTRKPDAEQGKAPRFRDQARGGGHLADHHCVVDVIPVAAQILPSVEDPRIVLLSEGQFVDGVAVDLPPPGVGPDGHHDRIV